MANCKYILGLRVFDSEILLDDYLSEMKNLYKLFGDEVFSKSWTPVLQTYREKLFSLKEQLEKAIKSGRIKLEISDMEDLDLDGIVDSAEGRGVTSLMLELKSLDDKNVFPIFNKDNYWDHVKGELREGNWESKKIKGLIPYIFKKGPDGSYETHPITTEEEFKNIREKIEKMWQQQGLIGTVVHDIFDILYSNYTTDNGVNIKTLPKELLKQEIKKLLKKKDEPNAYKKLLDTFGTDLNDNNSFLESVIDNAFLFNEDLKRQFDPENEGLMVLPEITIKGMATLNNQIFKVIGRMDMVVIKPNGEVHIVDYKCSPKEYRDYDSAKILTFNYQLAVYRRILQQLGINKDQIHLWVVPIQFTNFNIDDNNIVTLDGIKLREGATFEELEVSSPTVNANKYQIVEDNLNNSFKYEHVEDTSDEHILEKTRNWIRKTFPEYSKISEVTDENVLDFCKRRKCVVQDEKTGKWGFRRYKNADLKYVKDTEQEVINAIKQEWENNRQRNLESTKSLKKELEKAQKENLGRGALFNITLYSKDKLSQKTPDWALLILQKYSNKDWTVEPTPEAFDSLGIILVRNITTNRIDVVKLSSTYDLDAEIGYGNNRTTLFGNFVSDHIAKSLPNSLVMQSTRGNVELMETMYALNCMPSIFNNDSAFLGEIQVISHYNEGGGANNKSLLYNFLKLMNYSNKEDSPEVNYFNNKNIKVASFVQLALDTLTRIINNNQGTRWNKFEEASNNLHKSLGNKEQMLSELIKLKQQIENVPGFEYLARDGVMTSIYDDYNSPEKRLYAEVMLAIGEIGGLTYQQQTKDHANIFEGNSLIKAFLWDGFNGNLTDNPGTLRSETLNQASHLVDVAYLNIRDLLFKYKNNLEKVLDEYKLYKGQFATLKDLYENFYNKDITDDLVFKNPFIENDGRLDDMERKVLKAILLDIAHRRNSTIVDEETLKSAIENDSDYLLVPLIKSTSKPVTKSLGEFMSRTRKFLMGFNIKNAKDSLKEKLLDFTSKESTNEPNREETIWEMTNSIDVNPENRKERITLGGGIENFETNLEMLALKHEYAYILKQEINKILPFMKALSIHLANQGIILNDNFENDLNYILNFVKAKIQNKKLLDILSLDNSFVSDLMKGTSILALAFNPKQLYQIIDGLWKDVRLIVLNAHREGDINMSFKNFKDSFFWIILDVGRFDGKLSLGEALNLLYGINDMDINQLPSRYAKDTYGTDRLQKAMFRFASRPDYYNRMTIFGALMRGDGCFEAHSIVNGHLVYDWTKDKRFDIFAKYKGDISKVPSSEQNKFRLQQALYSAMADEMVKDRTLNPDGTNFVKDMKNPKPLPKAYTVRLSESMKALGDKTYGYYASEKKSLIQSFTIGAIIFQMNTFWSSKKNQYFSGRGYTQEGEFVDYVEENPDGSTTPYYLKYNEETGEMDITEENTGVPYLVWKGRPQEGIIITLNHMLMNIITGEVDYDGFRFWDPYWNDDDPYLRKMYRANLRLLLADLLGMILIGMIISPSLVNAANSYAKEIGSETIGEATMGYLTTLSAGMLQTSTDDFNFTKSVFGRGIQWTPFSLLSGTRFLTNCGNWLFGDLDFYDTLTKQMAFTRNAKPIMNFIKNETLGRDIGDNGKSEE